MPMLEFDISDRRSCQHFESSIERKSYVEYLNLCKNTHLSHIVGIVKL